MSYTHDASAPFFKWRQSKPGSVNIQLSYGTGTVIGTSVRKLELCERDVLVSLFVFYPKESAKAGS